MNVTGTTRAKDPGQARPLAPAASQAQVQAQAAKAKVRAQWGRLFAQLLPFADAASAELPLSRLARLSLFQVSVGMAAVLLTGTLNRVMILELGIPAWFVATMVCLPLLFAPFRALIGHRSDQHVSALGWRRVPYIWMGTLLQFGGLAIMPFALLALSEGVVGPAVLAQLGAGLAFLLVGAGLHTTQTAGLALATDLATEENRPRVVAFLYVMLLIGMALSSILFAFVLRDFDPIKLIQVIQAAALITLVLNVIALWRQEPRRPSPPTATDRRLGFQEAWSNYLAQPGATRALIAVGLGTAGFSMQDILLEPYGGEILALSVSGTTLLTALFAVGTLIGFALAARGLGRGADPYRLAGLGIVVGIFAFAMVTLSAPTGSASLFRLGTACIGLGGGLFAVGALTAAMTLASPGTSGIALGAWGAVQATAAGLGMILGGILRDTLSALGKAGALGEALASPAVGYSAVYHLEIALLFMALIALGPLVKPRSRQEQEQAKDKSRFGLADLPG